MNLDEVGELLSLAALTDRRDADEAVVGWWHELLADTDYADAREVLKRHYRSSTEYLMPVHIVRGVKEIRNARREAYGTLVPEHVWPELEERADPAGYHRKFQELAELVASGKVRRNSAGRPELTA